MAFVKYRCIEDAVAVSRPDMIITMGCGEECPFIPGVEYIDWELPDPSGQPIEFVRTVRDDIEKKVKSLIANL